MARGSLEAVLELDLPDEDRLKLLLGVVEGLGHLHSLNVIHGDLHPGNVLIDDNGNACLTDFGLSFICPEFIGTYFWSSTLGGALRWRAPELVAPNDDGDVEEYVPDLTRKCDIYSFGGLMLYVMSGEEPYHKSTDNKVILHLHHRRQPPRPPGPRLADSHWMLVTRCWGPPDKPTARPTAEEVAAAIIALQRLLIIVS